MCIVIFSIEVQYLQIRITSSKMSAHKASPIQPIHEQHFEKLGI